MAIYTDFVIVRSKWRWKRRTPKRNRYAGGSVRSNRERYFGLCGTQKYDVSMKLQNQTKK